MFLFPEGEAPSAANHHFFPHCLEVSFALGLGLTLSCLMIV
jgi:hypothetical protein